MFASLFDDRRTTGRPIVAGYSEFAKRWGWQKTLFSLADENILQVDKIQKMLATTVLNYLSYLKDKAIAEEQQEKYDEQLRKSRR